MLSAWVAIPAQARSRLPHQAARQWCPRRRPRPVAPFLSSVPAAPSPLRVKWGKLDIGQRAPWELDQPSWHVTGTQFG